MKINKTLLVGSIVVVVLIILASWFISARNNLVGLDEGLQQQWAKVEVQYQRRLDLIPNLVETVKGYAAHESGTFEKVTEARAGLTDAYNAAAAQQGSAATAATSQSSLDNYTGAQGALTRALSVYVNAVHEAYPDLKADTQFADLQTQLEGTENRIATERGRYTDIVKTYNVAVRTFPRSIVASMAGFEPKAQFQADAQAAEAPKVQF